MIEYIRNLCYRNGDKVRIEHTKLFKNTKIDTSLIQIKDFPGNYTIELEDEISEYIGIVLEGKIHVKAYSLGGKDFTITSLDPGHTFGDILIFGTESHSYPGNLITKGPTKIAMIPNEDIKNFVYNDHTFLSNYLELLSDKVYEMNSKSKLLSQDSIRDKILFFLHQQSRIQNSIKVKLNMTKEELANILFVQRPSLSRELIKMRKEGMIDFDRWTITLKGSQY